MRGTRIGLDGSRIRSEGPYPYGGSSVRSEILIFIPQLDITRISNG